MALGGSENGNFFWRYLLKLSAPKQTYVIVKWSLRYCFQIYQNVSLFIRFFLQDLLESGFFITLVLWLCIHYSVAIWREGFITFLLDHSDKTSDKIPTLYLTLGFMAYHNWVYVICPRNQSMIWQISKFLLNHEILKWSW